jgi:hypothetical protein
LSKKDEKFLRLSDALRDRLLVLQDAGYTLLGADLTGKHPRNYRRNAKHSVRACAETSEDINRLLRAWVRVA